VRYRETLSLLLLLLLLAAQQIAAIAPSWATPSEDQDCAYTLSSPHLTTASDAGGLHATATAVPVQCSGDVQPTMTTVCLRPSGGQGTCAVAYGWTAAQVFGAPPQGTAGYSATATGCATISTSGHQNCTGLGPVHANLTDVS
jgi:hypothetical protein